jgi:hypothetical protein
VLPELKHAIKSSEFEASFFPPPAPAATAASVSIQAKFAAI